jgi:hypothetical protein
MYREKINRLGVRNYYFGKRRRACREGGLADLQARLLLLSPYQS